MTSPPADDTPEEVDGADEADHDAQEIALGAAIAALLIAELLPGPASFISGTIGWVNRIDTALGPTLRGFMQRSAVDLAQDAGSTGTSGYTAALESVEETYPEVLEWVQERSHETLQNLTDSRIGEEHVARDATAAAENLARGAAVYAKSLVREHTVGKLGAVWKTWRTRHDNRVRQSHNLLDGQRVPYGSPFVTEEGSLIRFPGDPLAPIYERAGCRCRLVYQIQPLEVDYGQV